MDTPIARVVSELIATVKEMSEEEALDFVDRLHGGQVEAPLFAARIAKLQNEVDEADALCDLLLKQNHRLLDTLARQENRLRQIEEWFETSPC